MTRRASSYSRLLLSLNIKPANDYAQSRLTSLRQTEETPLLRSPRSSKPSHPAIVFSGDAHVRSPVVTSSQRDANPQFVCTFVLASIRPRKKCRNIQAHPAPAWLRRPTALLRQTARGSDHPERRDRRSTFGFAPARVGVSREAFTRSRARLRSTDPRRRHPHPALHRPGKKSSSNTEAGTGTSSGAAGMRQHCGSSSAEQASPAYLRRSAPRPIHRLARKRRRRRAVAAVCARAAWIGTSSRIVGSVASASIRSRRCGISCCLKPVAITVIFTSSPIDSSCTAPKMMFASSCAAF